MESRVTLQSIVHGALSHTRRLSNQLAALQAQAATGKRFANISDDPAATLTILASESQAQGFATHLDNITTATSKLNASASTLQQVSDLFSQARSLGLEASSSVNDAAAFDTMATQVDALLDRLVNLANMQNQDSYLFSGASSSQPFVVGGRDSLGRPLEVHYQGAGDETNMTINRDEQVAIEYPGDVVFQTRHRQATVFAGTTGAKPGTGTDNAIGRGELLVRHTATSFAPGSGVQVGTGSAMGDTILGAAGRHRLHITDTSGTGVAGTISMDGGPPVNFTNAGTNLRVTNSTGDVVFLDTTAITAGFDGDIDITADGDMSTDGGASFVPITFTQNQSVTGDGKVTFVDTTNIERAGKEAVNYPGTYDAFQALIALRDDLRNVRGLSEHDQILAISGTVGELERVHDHVLQVLGEQSASLQSLQSLQSHLQDLQLNAKKTASELGDIDISEVAVKLQAFQNMMQLSLATFARSVDQSLLDFLR